MFGGVIKGITGLKNLLRLVVSEQFSVKWIHLLDILMKCSFTSVLTGNVTQFAVGVSAGCLTSLSKSSCTQSPLCHWFGR